MSFAPESILTFGGIFTYEFTPKPKKLVLCALIFICAVLGVICFLPMGGSLLTELWMRALGFVLLVCAFILADRYIMTFFVYSVEASGGTLDFCVREVRYRRARVVCRVYLSEIKEIRHIEKMRRGDIPRGAVCFNYRRELLPSEHWILRGEGEDGEFFIRFSPNGELVDIIRNFLELKN